MTPQALKASLLQRAIQGKLVEQRPEEGSAEALYTQIQTEKAALIKAGKLKKDKPLPEITADELPFDIPSTWKWVRLGEIVTICTGKKDANFGSDFGEFNFFTCAKEPIRCNSFSFVGESILLAGNGDIGNISYFNGKFEAYQRTYVLQPYIECTYLRYLQYHISSNWVVYNKDKMFGTAIPYIRLGNVQNYLVALPPLAEQKRIVERIEMLLPLVERYEAAWERLNAFNKRFPADLQKSLLQMAIQGKLVEQRPEEGTAEALYTQIQAEKAALIKAGKLKKDKPLPEITADELPFDIPPTWKWVRLGEVATITRGSGIKRSETTESGISCVRYGEIYTTYGYSFQKTVSFTTESVAQNCKEVKYGDVLCTLTGECKEDIAKTTAYLGKDRVVVGGDLAVISNHPFVPLLLVYFMYSPCMREQKAQRSNGNMIVHIGKDAISNLLIPLPPLAEQQRIVERLEQLLALTQQLC